MTDSALHGAINLSQGFPDFDTHTQLKGLVAKYIRAGHNQYAPMQGVGELREAIAEKVRCRISPRTQHSLIGPYWFRHAGVDSWTVFGHQSLGPS